MSIFHDFVTALRLAFKAKFAWMAAGVLVMAALAMMSEGLSSREVVKIVSKEYGLSKNDVKSFLFAEKAED